MNDLQTARTILLVAPHRIGDTLFATPGIRLLRLAKPKAQMDAVALSQASYEVLQHHTGINKIYKAAECSFEQLASRYDIILPLQNIKKVQDYTKNTSSVLMLPRYTGAFHYAENFYRFVLQQLPEASRFPLGPYELNITASDLQVADALLHPIRQSSSHPCVIAIHMGCYKVAKAKKSFLYQLLPFLATRDSRSWSFKRFHCLIERLLTNYSYVHVVLTGSASEEFAANGVTSHPRLFNLMGKTNVTELAALLSQCQLLITGDTGPLHIACAVERPVVLLCGKTHPLQTGPHPSHPRHTIIHKNSMDDISVDEVYDAVTCYIG